MKQESRLRAAVRDVLEMPRGVLILRLSALLILLHGGHGWALDVLLSIACGAMLLSRRLLESPRMWLLTSLVLVGGNLVDWSWIDNHKYLITYWSIVCTLAVSSEDADQILAHNARMLITLVFGIAVGWKIFAGEYLDGAFFHFTLLTDQRLSGVARVIGGLEADTLPSNRALAGALALLPHSDLRIHLSSSLRLEAAALVISYWTLLMEAAIAAAFLCAKRRLGALRDTLLITFVLTTYPLVPVIGFGIVLGVMGLAQCEPERSKARVAYVVLLVAMQLAKIPWQELLVRS